MKKIFFFLLIVLIAGKGQAQTKASLQASGLTCAMCSKAVYKALSAVPFVDKVSANIQLSTYELNFKPEAKIDFDALSKAVVNAGFSVSMLKITTGFSNVKVQNDAHVVVNDQMFHFLNITPQTLNGDRTIVLIDKNFLSAKAFKKFDKATAMKCQESGMMDGQRVYHATL